jgi:putative copper export protein
MGVLCTVGGTLVIHVSYIILEMAGVIFNFLVICEFENAFSTYYESLVSKTVHSKKLSLLL